MYATVVNARFVKPLDNPLFVGLLAQIPRLITVEDHMVQGGFGSAVLEQVANSGLTGVSIRCLGVPDRFMPHGTQEELRALSGIDAMSIVRAGVEMIRIGPSLDRKDATEWVATGDHSIATV